MIKNTCKNTIKIGNYNVAICNSSILQSEIGEALSSIGDIDYALVWYYSISFNSIKVSLRSNSDNIDVSEIAKNFNGGGHIRSSGFSSTCSDINILIKCMDSILNKNRSNKYFNNSNNF
jgi:nanoRNase/pAp phosphatase (c-di-AMP/oligoRNAs hydrolase)